MIVYRFVPDGRRFRNMEVSHNDRFWPEGIQLGKYAELEFPKGISGTRWWLDGNHYTSSRGDASPLADVVATTMNILVLQEPTATALSLSASRVAVTVDGIAAVAYQLPEIEGAVDVSRSVSVSGPGDEPLFWNRLELIPERVTAEVFWIKEEMPFSYVYMTDTFVARAKNLGVTGLDYIEPIWDGTACHLSYPSLTNAGSRNGYRYYLETAFLFARAAMFGHLSEDIHPILDQALTSGRFPWRYPDPG